MVEDDVTVEVVGKTVVKALVLKSALATKNPPGLAGMLG